MQVTHFERLPMAGGHSIERLFREIRRALPEQFSVDVVGCETPYHSPWWLIKGIARARSFAAEVNHIVGDIHYVALGLPGNRTILTVHDLTRLGTLQGLRRQLYKLLYFSLPLRRCRYVVAISEHTRRHLLRLFPSVADKIVVIPDCVPGSFKRAPKNFSKACPRILQVGTRANKNLERMALALAGVPCLLHVIGALNREQQGLLKDLKINYENSVEISDDAVLRAYEQADMVLFVSLAEGFGLPIIEANAIGRPVVASKISPMKDVAADAACLVDPVDVTDIRRGILEVIENDDYRNCLIERGYQNAGRYSAQAVARTYVRLYEEIAHDEIATAPNPSRRNQNTRRH